MTFDDFRGALMVKAGATGVTEEHLLKIALVSINAHIDAVDRWHRLEAYDPGRSAPLWLNESEARKLAGALKVQRGTETRLIRQQLQEMFA